MNGICRLDSITKRNAIAKTIAKEKRKKEKNGEKPLSRLSVSFITLQLACSVEQGLRDLLYYEKLFLSHLKTLIRLLIFSVRRLYLFAFDSCIGYGTLSESFLFDYDFELCLLLYSSESRCIC